MSREPHPFVALGFASTHDALDAEAMLGDVGIGVVPIPTPKAIGAGCGISLRLDPADELRALEYLARAGIQVAARVDITDI
jgi:hypothetical protein